MHMGMKKQSLIPGVQYAEEPDLGAKVPRIAGHFDQRLGTCAKQQVEDDLRALVVIVEDDLHRDLKCEPNHIQTID